MKIKQLNAQVFQFNKRLTEGRTVVFLERIEPIIYSPETPVNLLSVFRPTSTTVADRLGYIQLTISLRSTNTIRRLNPQPYPILMTFPDQT